MMTISSEAGARLAKAKAAIDKMDEEGTLHLPDLAYHYTELEFEAASRAVADELIASGFDRMECEQ